MHSSVHWLCCKWTAGCVGTTELIRCDRPPLTSASDRAAVTSWALEPQTQNSSTWLHLHIVYLYFSPCTPTCQHRQEGPSERSSVDWIGTVKLLGIMLTHHAGHNVNTGLEQQIWKWNSIGHSTSCVTLLVQRHGQQVAGYTVSGVHRDSLPRKSSESKEIWMFRVLRPFC